MLGPRESKNAITYLTISYYPPEPCFSKSLNASYNLLTQELDVEVARKAFKYEDIYARKALKT